MIFFGGKVLPDFVLIGAQKCASTSLLAYMGQHSCIRLGSRKSTHYFDRNLDRSARWYASHFPKAPASLTGRVKPRDWLTGESCPDYIFLPGVPARMASLMPEARIIVILRDPVKRLVSQYKHEKRKGRVPMSFGPYVRQTLGLDWPVTGTPAFMLQQAAVQRGFYADQLSHWHKFYCRGQILVVGFEELVATPDPVMERIFRFLGLPPEKVDASAVLNPATGALDENIDPVVLEELRALYAEKNRCLAEIAGQDFPWLSSA